MCACVVVVLARLCLVFPLLGETPSRKRRYFAWQKKEGGTKCRDEGSQKGVEMKFELDDKIFFGKFAGHLH